MKFFFIGPGFQCMNEELIIYNEVNNKEPLQQIIEKYESKISNGQTIIFQNDDVNVIYKPIPGQHLIIMTESQFDKFRRDQQYLQSKQKLGLV